MNFNLKLVEAPALSLAVPCVYVALPNDRLQKFAKEAAMQMYLKEGIGLAASQVGYNIAMMLLSSEIEKFGEKLPESAKLHLDNNRYCYVLLNPRLSRDSDKLVDLFKGEGCLSFPIRDTGRVERYEKIQLQYQDLGGNLYSAGMSSYLATVVQHEADHLYGVLFPAKMKQRERELLLAKYCVQNAVKYQEMDRFKEIMLANVVRSQIPSTKSAMQKDFPDPLFKNSEELKSFCEKNYIDPQPILAKLSEIFGQSR